MSEELYIDAREANATIELTCDNSHDFKLDLWSIDEITLGSNEQESNSYMWKGISCPECDTSRIRKIDLGDIT